MIWNVLFNSLPIGSVYAILALGYSLIFATSGLLNFALGDAVMIGGFVGLTVRSQWEGSFLSAAVAGMAAAALISFLVERFLIRPLIHYNAKPINLLICTLGVAVVLRNGALRVWGPDVRIMEPLFKSSVFQLGPIRVDPQYVFIFWTGLLLMLALYLFIARTRMGRAMRALSQDRRAAALMGVDVDRYVSLAFVLSGAIAGAAGVMLAPILFVTSTMGAVLGMKGFVSAMVGGMGKLEGAVIGGMLLALVEALGASALRSGYRDAVAFAILILVLWLRPSGILSRTVQEKI